MRGDHSHTYRVPGTAPAGTTHPTVIAYAAGEVYARCACGWEGTHRPITRAGGDSAQALHAADREADRHTTHTE
ncbi:MAG: hypothetical protein ACRD0K_24980 [Egibacteraceae bacterium]